MKMKRNLRGRISWRRKMALGLCLLQLLGAAPLPENGVGEMIVDSIGAGTIEAEAADANVDFNGVVFYLEDGIDGTADIELVRGSNKTYKFFQDNDAVEDITKEWRTFTLSAEKDGQPVWFNNDLSINLLSGNDSTADCAAYADYVFETDGTKSKKQFRVYAKSPGSSEITLEVVYGTGATAQSITLSFSVEVDLSIIRNTDNEPGVNQKAMDYAALDYGSAGATGEDNYGFVFQYPELQYQPHLKYFNIITDAAINVKKYDYSKANLTWKATVDKDPSNYNVLTIDQKEGIMTSVGAGKAKVTVSPENGTSDMMEELDVIVPLKFSTTSPVLPSTQASVSADAGVDIYTGFQKEIELTTEPDGEAVIYSTAYDPLNDMEWYGIYDANGNEVNEDWFEISYEPMNRTQLQYASKITIKCAKAGTYTLKAYMKNIGKNEYVNKYDATVVITIPINYADADPIYMNVKDRYNLFKNTNIAVANTFTYESKDDSVVEVTNDNKGIFTARKIGHTWIYAYDKAKYKNLDEAKEANELITREVYVIDTLSLNTNKATIAVGGTLNLRADSTDITKEFVWEVEDEKIAKIESEGGRDAVVTGLKAGTTTIYVSQTIKGVEKTISCELTVTDTITKIELDPTELEMEEGEIQTITATASKSGTTNLAELYWVSSNPSVVEIVNPNKHDESCAIRALKGGTAIVMAVNKDNMVLATCKVTVLQVPTSIKMSETSVMVPQSVGKYQLYATVLPKEATNKNVTWSSSNKKIAEVDENGLVTFKSYGTVTIIATCEGKPELTAMCEMTIAQSVTSVILDQTTLTLDAGETYRLTYEVLPTTAYDRSVTFTSMDKTVAVVDATGRITAKKAGTTYITITTADGGYSKVCTVIVKQSATTIKLDATGLVLDVDESYSLEVTFNPKTTTETKLRWSSNDKSVAKVDTKGVVTAVGAGDCIISVTTENNLTAFCYVTVNQQVTGIELNYESVSVDMGKFVELEATIEPDDATNQDVKWTSSDDSIAIVSDNGTVKGVKGGSAIITATSDEGDYSAVCLVKVVERVEEIKLNKTSYKLGLGKKFTLKATITNSSATDQTVTWVSSNPEICTVNKKGVITGVKLGRATITAYANDDSEAEASCEVRVVKEVTSITLNTNLLNMVVGDSSTLKATIKPNDATYKTAKFVSSDTNVAIVDTNGKVTAVGAGTCNITAKAKDNSGKKTVCVVIVRPVVAATAITLNPTEITMGVGGSESVDYSLRPLDSTDSVTWTSNNKAVATVGRSSGIIRAVAPGSAVVTAKTSSGRIATVRVTVVGLNYDRLSLEQYDSYYLRVMGVTTGVIWDVDNPDICTVSRGKVTAKKAGTTTVVARVNGAELRCRVTVRDIER